MSAYQSNFRLVALAAILVLLTPLAHSQKKSNVVIDDRPKKPPNCLLLSPTFCGTFTDKTPMTMFAADVAAKTLDVRQTERDYQFGESHPCWARVRHSLDEPSAPCGFSEANPLVRPLVKHPIAFYSVEYTYALASAWLGHRMRQSRHGWIRDLWWAPQAFSIGQNMYGYATRVHANH